MAATNGQFWTQTFLKTNGTPYVGLRLFHYEAGTLNNKDLYSDAGLTVGMEVAQPFVGDSSGRVAFYGEGTYRFIIRSSVADGDLLLYDWDNIELWHKTATLRSEDQGTSNPAISAAHRGRFFAIVDGSGDLTNLRVVKDASTFAELVFGNTDHGQTIQWSKGADLASSSTLTLGTDGNYFDVTGTTTINTISTKDAGTPILLQFDGALTLTHSASIILLDATNYLTAAGDVLLFVSEGGAVWREVSRTHIGSPLRVSRGGTNATTFTASQLLRRNASTETVESSGYTVPGASGVVVGETDTQTVTNKTLTTCTIDANSNTVSNIGTDELVTATGSAISGATTAQDVTMNDYSFFPSITNDSGAQANVQSIQQTDPSNTIGRLRLTASGGGSTRVRWRYMSSTDNPRMWVAYDPATGQILAAWSSDDPASNGSPGVIVEGAESVEFRPNDLSPAWFTHEDLQQAHARIRAKGSRSEHLYYRALQVKTGDEAPAEWLLENCRINLTTKALERV